MIQLVFRRNQAQNSVTVNIECLEERVLLDILSKELIVPTGSYPRFGNGVKTEDL